MVSLLASAVQSHWRRLKAASGVVCSYSQDGEIITPTLVPAFRSTQVESSDGAIVTSMDVDFLALVSDLVFATGVRYPKRRDKITYTDESGFQRKYEVSGTGGERHYDPCDAYGVMIRIHAVEISLEAVTPPEMTSWIWADGDTIVTADGDNLVWQG